MEIIAHRGASGRAPENTQTAFRLAWELGADGIELDVRLSRDRQIVVHHDETTKRTAGIPLKVADTDWATLKDLDVGRWRDAQFAGTTMPTLADVLTEVPAGKRVLVEIKTGPEIVPPLAALLTEIDHSRYRLAIISFHLKVLLACREALPDVPCYPVFSAQYGDDPAQLTFEQWIVQAKTHGFAGLDPDHRDIAAERAAAVRAAGLELITWTVNSPRRMQTLAAYEVAAVATDWPGQLLEALAK